MPSLEEIMKQEIRSHGPMTFARFMELALYHPEHGYYASGRARIGKAGDFYTNPHTGPVFGRLVAELYLRLKEKISGGRCAFVEMGAGEGLMARDFLEGMRALHPEEFADAKYIIIERSDGMRKRQTENLGALGDKVTWYESLTEMPGAVDGVFFSNELVDALPVHRVRQAGGLKELYINLKGGHLIEEEGPLSTPDLSAYFDRLGISLPEGMTTEANLEALGWMREVAGKLNRGFVVTVDYGYPASDYYSSKRGSGTLMCYRAHKATEDPLAYVGEQDITAHADFTSLALVGKEVDLTPIFYADQSSFLTGPAGWLNEALLASGASQEELEKTGRGLITILHPDWMGGAFKALVQSKGVDGGEVFRGARNQMDTLMPS